LCFSDADMPVCAGYNCYKRIQRGTSLFKFPKNPKLCHDWLRCLGRTDLYDFSYNDLKNGGFRVCQKHFPPSFIYVKVWSIWDIFRMYLVNFFRFKSGVGYLWLMSQMWLFWYFLNTIVTDETFFVIIQQSHEQYHAAPEVALTARSMLLKRKFRHLALFKIVDFV